MGDLNEALHAFVMIEIFCCFSVGVCYLMKNSNPTVKSLIPCIGFLDFIGWVVGITSWYNETNY